MAKKKKKKAAAGGQPAPPAPRKAGSGGVLPTVRLRYQIVISLLILIAAICVLYPELVFEDKMFIAPDAESALSLSTPIKEAMDQGEFPQWNPHLFSGMPSYGSLSYVPNVYPVTFLTGFLITYLKFPNFTWLLFHVFMLGLGVWLVLIDRGVHFLIAAGVGVAMMWMPNHVAVGVHGHGSQACAVGYMPFALFFWDRLWRGKGVLLNASALVILLGFQFLRAHLQITYYTFLLLGMHYLFFSFLKIKDAFSRGRVDGRPTLRVLRSAYEKSVRRGAILDVVGAGVVLGVIVVGAVAISAVLFLPVHDYAQYSIRGGAEAGGLDYDYATSWSLHPVETLTLAIPFSFGFGKYFYYGHMPFTDYPNYLGVIVLLFAIIALFVARTRFVMFLASVVIFTTLVSFGKYFPIVYGPLFKLLPYFDKFRVPVMILIVQQLAAALLCGFGISAVFSIDPTRGARKALLGVGVAVALLVIFAVSYGYWSAGFAESVAPKIRLVRSVQEQIAVARMAGGLLAKDLVTLSMLLLATTTALWLYFRRYLPATALVLIVIGIVLIDFYRIDRDIIHPEKMFRSPQLATIKEKSVGGRVLEPDALIEFLEQQDGYYRVFPMTHLSQALVGDFETNRYMNFGISSIGGYHPAKLFLYQELIEALRVALPRGDFRMIDMLNARYVITSNPLPENPVLTPVWQGLDYNGTKKFVYENQRAFPRVFFVDEFEVRPGDEALNEMLADATLDLSQVALLESAPPIDPVSAEGATASITEYRLNEIRIDATLPAPAILVLSEAYYPAWKVRVDGEPGDVIRADHILRAVALPAGEHEVVFQYDSSLFKRSVTLSVVTLSAAVLALLFAVVSNLRGRMQWNRS